MIGDVLPLGGSRLEKDVGFEYSLLSSRLEGLAPGLCAELLSDGGPVLQSIVIPSIGYGSWGTVASDPCCE